MSKDKALKLALEAMKDFDYDKRMHAIQVVEAALAQPEPDRESYQKGHNDGVAHHKQAVKAAQPEQEPVAWLLTDKNINSLQVDSIQRLINRLNHAHHTDLRVRINGQDEWFQADWLKHMVRATPPKRQPLILDQYAADLLNDFGGGNVDWWQDYIRAELDRSHDFYQSQAAHDIKEKNT